MFPTIMIVACVLLIIVPAVLDKKKEFIRTIK